MADVFWAGTYDTDQHANAYDNNFMNGNINLGLAGDDSVPVTMAADPGTTFLFMSDGIFRQQTVTPSWGYFEFHGDVDNPIIMTKDPTTFPSPIWGTVARCQAWWEGYHQYDWQHVLQQFMSHWGPWPQATTPDTRFSWIVKNSLYCYALSNGTVVRLVPFDYLADGTDCDAEIMCQKCSFRWIDDVSISEIPNTSYPNDIVFDNDFTLDTLHFSKCGDYVFFWHQRINGDPGAREGTIDYSGLVIKNIFLMECTMLQFYFENREGGGVACPGLVLPSPLIDTLYIGNPRFKDAEGSWYLCSNQEIHVKNLVLDVSGLSFNSSQQDKCRIENADFYGENYNPTRCLSGCTGAGPTFSGTGATIDNVYAVNFNRQEPGYCETEWQDGLANPPYQAYYITNAALTNPRTSPIFPLDVENVQVLDVTQNSVTITFDSKLGSDSASRRLGVPVVKYSTTSAPPIYEHIAGKFPEEDLGLISAEVQFDWDGNPRTDLAGISFKTTGHSITINNLQPDTTYYFVPMIQDPVNRIGDENGTEYSFTTEPEEAEVVPVEGGSSGPVKIDETIKPTVLIRRVELKDNMEDIYEKMLIVKSLKIT